MAHSPVADANPLLASPWPESEHGLPPFSSMKPEHFIPAFDAACATHLAEVAAIASNTAAPSFATVIEPLEAAGAALRDVQRCFGVLCASVTTPELQAVERTMSPRLAAHASAVYMYPGLFSKLDALYAARTAAGLTSEQLRCVERHHLAFVREGGARLDARGQQVYAAITEQLAALETRFSQNVLADETEYTIPLSEADLSGCPPDLVAAARCAALERQATGDAVDAVADGSSGASGAGTHVVTLSRSLVEPFLTFADRRDLRERAWRAWTRRGELNAERDNRRVILEILRLRSRQAALHGYASFAEFQTADTMAGSPAAVMRLLESVWPRAREAADRERSALAALQPQSVGAAADAPGTADDDVAPWDWRYLAEKVRMQG